MTQHTDEEYNVLYEWVIEVANQNQSLYIQRTTGELRIAALEKELDVQCYDECAEKTLCPGFPRCIAKLTKERDDLKARIKELEANQKPRFSKVCETDSNGGWTH